MGGPGNGPSSRIDDFVAPLVPWPPRGHATRSPRSFPKGGSAMALEPLSRRMLLTTMGAVAGAAALGSRLAMAQTPPPGAGRAPEHGHHAAARLRPERAADHLLRSRRHHRRSVLQRPVGSPIRRIKRLWTGALWSEGPPGAPGRYLVWSDIPNNRQLRWLEDDGRVSVFRMPSNNSNGNTFDFQGRQLVLRASDAARRALRARRLGDGHRRQPTTASGSTRPTTSCRIPTAATGSPIRPTAASSTKGTPDAPGGPSNAGGTAQAPARPAARDRHAEARAADQRAIASIRAGGSISW